MASFLNFGSYQKYKDDTKTFLEWLACDAAVSGCVLSTSPPISASTTQMPSPTPTSTSQSKTHAEKLREKVAQKAQKREEKKVSESEKNSQRSTASLKTRIAATTNEVLRQAKAAAKNTKLQVPEDILKAAIRAIRSRKRFGDWFRSNKINNGYSDDGHQHFIWVLEEALRILKPRISLVQRINKAPRPITTPSHNVMSRFQRILLEDDTPVNATDETEDAEDMEDILNTPSNQQLSRQQGQQGTESPRDNASKIPTHDQSLDTFDGAFAVFCFFLDLHNIRCFLGNTWILYKNQKIDLTTASFTTTAAMDIVQREGEKLARLLFPEETKGVPWAKLVALISGEADLMGLKKSISDPSIFDLTYPLIAMWLRKLSEDLRPSKHLECTWAPPLGLHFMEFPGFDDLLETTSLQYEYKFLAQMIIESQAKGGFEEYLRTLKKPQNQLDEMRSAALGSSNVQDAFVRGMCDFMDPSRGTLEVSFVFASRIVLDVQNILGDHVLSGDRQLKAAVLEAENCFDYVTDPALRLRHPKTFVKSELVFVEEALRFIVLRKQLSIDDYYRAIVGLIKDASIAASELAHSWESLGNRQRGMKFIEELRSVWMEKRNDLGAALDFMTEYGSMPRETPYLNKSIDDYMPIGPLELPFEKSHNPTHCGLDLLELDLKMERVRLGYTNLHWSTFLMAHLYNAAKHTGALRSEVPWPEMDRVINVHISTIFAGEIPKNPDKFFRLLHLKLGYSQKRWLVNRHGKSGSDFTKCKREETRKGSEDAAQFSCSKVSLILRQLYDKEQPISMERCLFLLNQQISEHKKSSRNGQAQKLNAVELLERIRDWMQPEMQMMKFDYMRLDKVCGQLLKRIRLSCLVELMLDYPILIQAGEELNEREQGYVNMVSNILMEIALAETFAPGETKRPMGNITGHPLLSQIDDHGREAFIFPGTPQVKLVGKILEKFLSELNNGGESSAATKVVST